MPVLYHDPMVPGNQNSSFQNDEPTGNAFVNISDDDSPLPTPEWPLLSSNSSSMAALLSSNSSSDDDFFHDALEDLHHLINLRDDLHDSDSIQHAVDDLPPRVGNDVVLNSQHLLSGAASASVAGPSTVHQGKGKNLALLADTLKDSVVCCTTSPKRKALSDPGASRKSFDGLYHYDDVQTVTSISKRVKEGPSMFAGASSSRGFGGFHLSIRDEDLIVSSSSSSDLNDAEVYSGVAGIDPTQSSFAK